jgi:hypothetical protein
MVAINISGEHRASEVAPESADSRPAPASLGGSGAASPCLICFIAFRPIRAKMTT